MKGKSIVILALSSLLVVVANSSIASAQQEWQQLTKQIRPELENLPNADYLYGDSPFSIKVGGRYLYLRKNGKNVTGLIFTYKTPGRRYCFTGRVNKNIINAVTTAERITNSNKWAFSRSRPFFLDKLYGLNSNQVANDAQLEMPECLRVFYYGRQPRI